MNKREAIEYIQEWLKDKYALNEKDKMIPNIAIETLQSEHPKGKWIEHEWAEEVEGWLISNYECSECHNWERSTSNFCPNCGASMKGKE